MPPVRQHADEQLARCPSADDVGSSGFSRASGTENHGAMRRPQPLNAGGQPVLKAGVDYSSLSYAQTKAYSGGVYFARDPSWPAADRVDRLPALWLQTCPDTGRHLAA
jgi:hypothetical protein